MVLYSYITTQYQQFLLIFIARLLLDKLHPENIKWYNIPAHIISPDMIHLIFTTLSLQRAHGL